MVYWAKLANTLTIRFLKIVFIIVDFVHLITLLDDVKANPKLRGRFDFCLLDYLAFYYIRCLE